MDSLSPSPLQAAIHTAPSFPCLAPLHHGVNRGPECQGRREEEKETFFPFLLAFPNGSWEEFVFLIFKPFYPGLVLFSEGNWLLRPC